MNHRDEKAYSRWTKSRAGAWAGRGFHYQHLFSTLIIIRQWAGSMPTGVLIPEGLEDCVIELPEREIWIQVKSRSKGLFTKKELQNVLDEVKTKAKLVQRKKELRLIVGIEKSCNAFEKKGLEQLFADSSDDIIICGDLENKIISQLTKTLDIANITAEGLANNLYKFVVNTSVKNASVTFNNRQRISTTDVERHIYNYLEAVDTSAIDAALINRIIEPVDFTTPISELGFYQGIKAKAGHVTAGLILKRPDDTDNLISLLNKHRHLLITAPSGSGKSALLWLAANKLSDESRVFEIIPKAKISHVNDIIRFVRARRPIIQAPISLVLDEIDASNSDLWDVLVNEFRGISNVFLLGTIRTEDKELITNKSDTIFFKVSLNEKLAQDIWKQLHSQKLTTTWSHWREPFEQSDGLMLEYVHILTKGERLESLISEQVTRREKEERYDELAIIRMTAVISSCGGEVNTNKLFKLLSIPPDKASKALKRLIDEHLVRESMQGVLGGLHQLRSKALSNASHDGLVFYFIEPKKIS